MLLDFTTPNEPNIVFGKKKKTDGGEYGAPSIILNNKLRNLKVVNEINNIEKHQLL